MVCKVSRSSCCLINFACHVKPLVLLFLFLQLTLLIVIVLHLRGVVDLLSPLDFSAPLPEKYKNYLIVNENEVFKLRDTKIEYFRTQGGVTCLIAGTKAWGYNKCECHDRWNGDDCGTPDMIWHLPKQLALNKRDKPRRLIYAFPVNESIDLVEIRIEELREVVDVFIILEYKESKEMTVLSQLSKGWLSDYADHLLYIQVLSSKRPDNEILTDQIVHHLNDVRPDDFVIFTLSDEIPSDRILECLKLYDGFPEIFSLYFQQFLYGFYNPTMSANKSSQIQSFPPTVTTIHFLLRDCDGQSSCLQAKSSDFVLGTPEYPAGWKCKQCKNSYQPKIINEIKDFSHQFIPKYVLAHQTKFFSLLSSVQEPLNVTSKITKKPSIKSFKGNVTKINK